MTERLATPHRPAKPPMIAPGTLRASVTDKISAVVLRQDAALVVRRRSAIAFAAR